MMKPQLVLCNGAELPQNSQSENWGSVIELNPSDSGDALFHQARNALTHKLSYRFCDLIDIAACVCKADYISTECGQRHFHFVIPVRNPDYWEKPIIRESLVSALNFLSGDIFEFEFSRYTQKSSSSVYFEISGNNLNQFKGIECVTLFSGGLDSLAGAIATAATGKPQVLISYLHSDYERERIHDLYSNLNRKFSSIMIHIPIGVNTNGSINDSHPRTHSFLLSTLGAAVASVINAGGIRLYSNGISSLHWQLKDETPLSRVPHATHPGTLSRLQAFYRLLFVNEVFVMDNPYVDKSKSEVVKVISDNGAKELIQYSSSCMNKKTQLDCGLCEHCVGRRMAILAAELEPFDSINNYVSDIFELPQPDHPINPMDHEVAVRYARFASDFSQMSDQQIRDTYRQDIALAADSFQNVDEMSRVFIDMHKRHSRAVLDVLKNQVNMHNQELVRNDLEVMSLMVIAHHDRYIGLDDPAYGPLYDKVYGNKHIPDNPQKCIFKKKGATWSVSFNGNSADVEHTKGMIFIHHLLEHRNTNVDVFDLCALAPVKSNVGNIAPVKDFTKKERDEITTLDNQDPYEARKEYKAGCTYRKELKKLGIEKQDAMNKGHTDVAKDKQKEIDNLTETYNSYFDKKGRIRVLDDPTKKAYNLINRDIKLSYIVIARFHPTLPQHLTEAINYRAPNFKYKPDKSIEWNLK